MTQDEYNEAAALVVRLRKELEHTNQHLVAHIDALTKSNAQCADYLRQNEKLAADRATLHKELVEVRAALASVSKERDSLKRTLQEWEESETKPHARVAADDIADHVVPPVLPMCTTCHGCGGPIIYGTVVGSPSVLHCRNEHCLRRNTAWRDDISPYHGPCKSSTPVRHE